METVTNLEQEIADIERRLAEKKALQQAQQGEQSAVQERDILREVVKEKAQEFVPSYQPSSGTGLTRGLQQSDNVGIGTANPPSYLSDELKSKVQELVDLAFSKDLAEAVKEVSKINNPALTDAFHDVLVDQLFDALVERGKLEKI